MCDYPPDGAAIPLGFCSTARTHNITWCTCTPFHKQLDLLTHFGHHRWCHSQSVLGKDTVRSFAEALGHAEVEDDVCTLLASDLEYRLREITQVHSYICTFVALSLTSIHTSFRNLCAAHCINVVVVGMAE